MKDLSNKLFFDGLTKVAKVIKSGFHVDIEKETIDNNNFRKVINTEKHSQLVLMSLNPGEDIGSEIHNVDQFFRFEAGSGIVNINESTYEVKDGDAVVIPAGFRHNIINTGDVELKLYTIYSPPQHKDGEIVKRKEIK